MTFFNATRETLQIIENMLRIMPQQNDTDRALHAVVCGETKPTVAVPDANLHIDMRAGLKQEAAEILVDTETVVP